MKVELKLENKYGNNIECNSLNDISKNKEDIKIILVDETKKEINMFMVNFSYMLNLSLNNPDVNKDNQYLYICENRIK
jgi:hypothetical protein